MKRRISGLLVRLACWINPKMRKECIEPIDGYEAKKLGLCILRSKKEIKEYRKKRKLEDGLSCRNADNKLVALGKHEIRQRIIDSIDKNGLIEYSVEKVGDELHISGDIKVYIKKE